MPISLVGATVRDSWAAMSVLRCPLGNVGALRGEGDQDPGFPQFLHGPPHAAHGHAQLLGELPLTLQPGPRLQLSCVDQPSTSC